MVTVGTRYRFYEEVQNVFDRFLKENMRISLGEEDIFNQLVKRVYI
jgi:hypothetical protein